jgi:hypothetical protein
VFKAASVSSIGVAASLACILVEIDMVRLQPPKAGFYTVHDVASQSAYVVWAGSYAHKYLCG